MPDRLGFAFSRAVSAGATGGAHSVGELKTSWNTGGKSQLVLDLEHDYDAPGRSFSPILHDSAHLT